MTFQMHLINSYHSNSFWTTVTTRLPGRTWRSVAHTESMANMMNSQALCLDV